MQWAKDHQKTYHVVLFYQESDLTPFARIAADRVKEHFGGRTMEVQLDVFHLYPSKVAVVNRWHPFWEVSEEIGFLRESYGGHQWD